MKLSVACIALMLMSTSVFAKEPEPKKEETATVHIYRKSHLVGKFWSYRLRVNGKKVKIRDGRYYEVKVPVGDVKIRSLTAKHHEVDLHAEPGKDYYVKPYMRAGMFWNFVELAEVTPQFATKDAQKLKKKRDPKIVEAL